jgi:hypothetical protein
MDATFQSFELLAWNGIAKNTLQNVEQLNQNVAGIDMASKGAMNVFGTRILNCINRLDELSGCVEGICLF